MIIQKIKTKPKAKNPYFFISLRSWDMQKYCLKTLENFEEIYRIKIPERIADFSTENENKKMNPHIND